MTAPSNYFYDGQIRRFIGQFIRMVSNFYVQFGTDSSGNITYQRVPVMYGDPSRQAAQIIKQNSENTLNAVPAMSVYIDSFNYDQTRLQDPSLVQSMSIRQREFDPVTGTYGTGQGQSFTVERVMPAPYKLGLKMDIWTSNTEQKLQIIEQISQLFNPAMEIQSTDNYIDWTSLSYALLTDMNWTSRTVPTGSEEPIDVATMKFDLPVWISTNVKVKKLGVIQTVINNYQDLETMTQLNTASGTAAVTLLKQSDIVKNNFASDDTTGANNSWSSLLNAYGNFISGSSEIRLMQPNGSEIIGTIATNPTDPTQLIYSPFEATLPANTLDPITAIIDPQTVNVGSYLTNPATGTTYLLLNDVGTFQNPGEGPSAWQGADGQNLVAHANDIVQYNGQHWSVIFDSETVNTLQYVTNLTTGIQYKWLDNQWTKSYDGVYPAGQWSLVV